jgi:excisionase family DNA binding protein
MARKPRIEPALPEIAPAQLNLTFPCTVEEFATFLKVTPRTIHRLANDREIQAFRVGAGGDWRFTQAAVEDFMLRNSNWIVEKSRPSRAGRKKKIEPVAA